MKLQFLVPQYEETDDVLKPLLDSIALQQQVDFNEIGVIICNDGSDVRLSEDFLKSYPFRIEYHLEKHRGVSAARNACLDHAEAEYVMFCDADDMFFSMCGLWQIFQEIKLGFDVMVSLFVEESKIPEDLPNAGEITYINHETDSTFVHGKVFRKAYLEEKNIRFNPKLTIHEDSFFNILAQNCTENAKYTPSPFYLWKWRDNSVCRHDPKYILKTYNNLVDSNEELIKEFIQRGMQDKANMFTGMMIFDAYYTMNKPEWINQENKQYRRKVEKRFKTYYRDHKEIWEGIPQQERMMISNTIRSRIVSEGMMMEAITISDWLKKLEK